MKQRGELGDGERLAVRRDDEIGVDLEQAAQAGDLMLAALGEPVVGTERGRCLDVRGAHDPAVPLRVSCRPAPEARLQLAHLHDC